MRVVLRMDAESDLLAIDVVDTGIGIDPSQVEMLFRPFTQADTSTTRRFGGTGLGLTISRRFAELLGGTITVDAGRGMGSTFTVLVATGEIEPTTMLTDVDQALAAGRASQRRPRAPERSLEGQLEGLRILVGEDTPDNQRLIRFHLEMGGATADIVGTGRETVAAALEAERRGEAYDVILMDMQMPEIDGYEAARLLRQGQYPRPIIALTAHAMSGDRERCLAAGMDE